MSHTGALNGQTLVGTIMGLGAGLYQALTNAITSDVGHAILLAGVGAVTGFIVTETLKALKKPIIELIGKIKKKLFKK